MILTLTLDITVVDSLRREAVQSGKTVEELIRAVIEEYVQTRPNCVAIASDEAFQEAMRGTMEKNAELYRRLAKH